VHRLQQAVLALGSADMAQSYSHWSKAVPVFSVWQGLQAVRCAKNAHETASQCWDGQLTA